MRDVRFIIAGDSATMKNIRFARDIIFNDTRVEMVTGIIPGPRSPGVYLYPAQQVNPYLDFEPEDVQIWEGLKLPEIDWRSFFRTAQRQIEVVRIPRPLTIKHNTVAIEEFPTNSLSIGEGSSGSWTQSYEQWIEPSVALPPERPISSFHESKYDDYPVLPIKEDIIPIADIRLVAIEEATTSSRFINILRTTAKYEFELGIVLQVAIGIYDMINAVQNAKEMQKVEDQIVQEEIQYKNRLLNRLIESIPSDERYPIGIANKIQEALPLGTYVRDIPKDLGLLVLRVVIPVYGLLSSDTTSKTLQSTHLQEYGQEAIDYLEWLKTVKDDCSFPPVTETMAEIRRLRKKYFYTQPLHVYPANSGVDGSYMIHIGFDKHDVENIAIHGTTANLSAGERAEDILGILFLATPLGPSQAFVGQYISFVKCSYERNFDAYNTRIYKPTSQRLIYRNAGWCCIPSMSCKSSYFQMPYDHQYQSHIRFSNVQLLLSNHYHEWKSGSKMLSSEKVQ